MKKAKCRTRASRVDPKVTHDRAFAARRARASRVDKIEFWAYRQITDKGMSYRTIFVSDGISQGKSWGTFFWTATGSIKRLTSPKLPMRPTKEQAQADLDDFVQCKNGSFHTYSEQQLHIVRACKHCGCTDGDGCDGRCYWVKPGVCSNCMDVEKQR